MLQVQGKHSEERQASAEAEGFHFWSLGLQQSWTDVYLTQHYKGLPMKPELTGIIHLIYSSDVFNWIDKLVSAWAGAQLLCCLMHWEKRTWSHSSLGREAPRGGRTGANTQRLNAEFFLEQEERHEGGRKTAFWQRESHVKKCVRTGKNCGVQLTVRSGRVCSHQAGQMVRGCEGGQTGSLSWSTAGWGGHLTLQFCLWKVS